MKECSENSCPTPPECKTAGKCLKAPPAEGNK